MWAALHPLRRIPSPYIDVWVPYTVSVGIPLRIAGNPPGLPSERCIEPVSCFRPGHVHVAFRFEAMGCRVVTGTEACHSVFG